MSGLSFLQKGGELNRELTVNAGRVDLYQAGPAFNHISFKMNYLELPLKLGYKFQLGDKLDLIPSIGIYGSYGFNAGNCSLDVYHSYENYGAYVPAQWKPFDGYYKVDDASSSSVSVIPLDVYKRQLFVSSLRNGESDIIQFYLDVKRDDDFA